MNAPLDDIVATITSCCLIIAFWLQLMGCALAYLAYEVL